MLSTVGGRYSDMLGHLVIQSHIYRRFKPETVVAHLATMGPPLSPLQESALLSPAQNLNDMSNITLQ